MQSNPWISPPRNSTGQPITNPAITGGSISGSSITNVTGVPYLLAQSAVPVNGPANTSENILATINIPILTANAQIWVALFWSLSNTADDKTLRVRLGGIGGTEHYAVTLTTQLVCDVGVMIGNAGATNSQRGHYRQTTGVGAAAISVVNTSAIDTSAATTLVITGQKETAGDTLTLESYSVLLSKP